MEELPELSLGWRGRLAPRFTFVLGLDSADRSKPGHDSCGPPQRALGPLAHQPQPSHQSGLSAAHSGTHPWSALITVEAIMDTGAKHPRILQAHTTSALDGLPGHPWHRAFWDFLAQVPDTWPRRPQHGTPWNTLTYTHYSYSCPARVLPAQSIFGNPQPMTHLGSSYLAGCPLCRQPWDTLAHSYFTPMPSHLGNSSIKCMEPPAHASHSLSQPAKVTRHTQSTQGMTIHKTILSSLGEVAVLPMS